MIKTAYVVDIARTPVGKFAGTLSSVRPDDLAAHIIKSLLERQPNFDKSLLEDVIFGAANQAGEDNRNVARMAGLMAGLPIKVGGITVNRLCASGLQSIMDASRSTMLGDGEAFIAGGVESMTRAPFVMAKAETAYSRKPEVYDTTIGWRFINPKLSEIHYPFAMGETAENVAEKWKISREAQDEFAHNSQLKYDAAHKAGKFSSELVSVSIPQRKADDIIFDKDEHPRLSSIEKLGSLKPAFRKDGSVTAGNASGVNDGSAASLIVDEETLKKFNLKPMARVVSMAIAGVSPDTMGIGPVPASLKALKRAGLKVSDLDLIELNEAFASQSIACVQDLDLNPEIINVNGGSIAIGHPLGASGTRISATLLHEMQKRENVKYGLATMCVGVGQGAAIIYEKI
ncbi:acetyl-CoA acetyltransferase [Marivirga tractuosa]|uniref:Acetyl-CoA acetyltransferase n=1 Tax=Marivirga tractuosa (strain ATCC 23168 / DSM 4126 / NBRC 15989 / NCIMB 1408 / VKM B-1430 / H-43) TaxID=643867 RepID=E4TRW7_MARTH|nr:acetyl-CoA acetyltransferase [Marivirga tractuosa DSM 4126]BDD14831.1 acetyl-CoA acetyltransferase [Marivirga tractuosa]